MLYSNTEDPLLIDILHRLINAEFEDVMDGCFKELEQLFNMRSNEFRKAADKERAKMGIVRMVGKDELAAAAEEWGMEMPSQSTEPDEDDE